MKNILFLSSDNSLFFKNVIKYFKNRTDINFKLLTDNLNAQVFKDAQKLKIESLWLDKDEIKTYLLNKKFDLIIVDNFNQILDKEITASNNLITLHFSCLPKYRTINPIKEAFLNSDFKTGLTIYKLNEKIYDGDVIYQKEINVNSKWGLNRLEKELYKVAFKYYPLIIEKLIGLNVLVLGDDAREQAIIENILKSQYLNKLYVADCSDYFLRFGDKINYKNFDSLIVAIKKNNINFVIINDTRYCENGLVDLLNKNKIKTQAPNKKEALFESSKIFAKKKLIKHDFKTALYKKITNKKDIEKFLSYFKNPIIKADGLTNSKGVYFNSDTKKTQNELYKYLDGKYEKASKVSLIEEKLFGFEVSLYSFWDGENIIHLPLCKNFKQSQDNLYSEPIASVCPIILEDKNKLKFRNFIQKLDLFFKKEEFNSGFLFCTDLLVADDDIYVLEFNFGFKKSDCENLINYIKNDWLEILYSCYAGMLDDIKIVEDSKQYTTICLFSKGYPLKTVDGGEISNIEKIKKTFDNVKIYFSNIIVNDEKYFSNDGRVLSVTSKDRSTIYRAISHIGFNEKMFKDNIEATKE